MPAVIGPLRVNPLNGRYLTDQTGKGLYVAGSTYWPTVIDSGITDPPPAFGFEQYLADLKTWGHNFVRLWTYEHAWQSSDSTTINYYFDPVPYQRTGPGNALDGKLKFDLTKFDDRFFQRVRRRAERIAEYGMLCSVMIASGGWGLAQMVTGNGNPWQGHPYNSSNNINGVNGDTNADNDGRDCLDTTNPAHTHWVALMKRIVDTVNDLDNIVYEICNEGPNSSVAWQYAMITEMRNYLAGKKSHPIWMTSCFPTGSDTDLFNSSADLISPNNLTNDYEGNPPNASGAKVILVDTDHTCGLCLPTQFPWKTFTRGHHSIYMDYYSTYFDIDPAPTFTPSDPALNTIRRAMGSCVRYSRRIDLNTAVPSQTLSSTAYCLAAQRELLIYNPTALTSFTVDLSTYSGTFAVEWYSNSLEATQAGADVSGGAVRNFSPPNTSYDVLFLYQRQDAVVGRSGDLGRRSLGRLL